LVPTIKNANDGKFSSSSRTTKSQWLITAGGSDHAPGLRVANTDEHDVPTGDNPNEKRAAGTTSALVCDISRQEGNNGIDKAGVDEEDAGSRRPGLNPGTHLDKEQLDVRSALLHAKADAHPTVTTGAEAAQNSERSRDGDAKFEYLEAFFELKRRQRKHRRESRRLVKELGAKLAEMESLDAAMDEVIASMSPEELLDCHEDLTCEDPQWQLWRNLYWDN
jgi:hypothetical protein